ncbi:FtsX-like permease family protein [Pirellulaceae bacterium SH449]
MKPRVRPLDRMLLSDLTKLWRQWLAISLLLACGIALFVMSTSTAHSLQTSRQIYYKEYRFADLFAWFVRAPEGIVERIAAVPGVDRAEGRIVQPALLDIPGMIEPASCRLVSIERESGNRLNDLALSRGRFPSARERNEIVISEPFAEAHQLNPGDTLVANIGGKRERLSIVGIGLSPEYIYAVQPGMLLTDNRRFGVFWMHRQQMEAAFNMDGAINQISVTLFADASPRIVMEEMERLLRRYGCRGVDTRSEQESDQRVSDELHQMASMSLITPSIFLAVTAFLFHIILTRLVKQQTDQIAMLRAFGYREIDIVRHYLKLIALPLGVGIFVGIAIGVRLSWWTIDLYLQFFRFPEPQYLIAYPQLIVAVIIAGSTAILGGFSALRHAVRLQPATAMRPESPMRIGTHWFDSHRLGRYLPILVRLILRRLSSKPTTTGFSLLGIAFGIAILVVGSFLEGTIDFVMDTQFGRSQRQDIMISFRDPLAKESMLDAKHITGVIHVEPFRSVPVRMRNGSREHRLAILGLEPDSELFRVLDAERQPITVGISGGLTITQNLADKLQVRLGDEVEIEISETDFRIRVVPITAVFPNFTDPAAYMARLDLHRLLQEGERISGVFLQIDRNRTSEMYKEIKETPEIASVLDNRASKENFQELIDSTTRVMRLINALFGCLIACGVMYNSALINLLDSQRDLATLRVLGFSKREVAMVLVGELALLTMLAIPIGLPIGTLLSYIVTLSLDTETHRFPLIISRRTYMDATLILSGAAMLASIVVYRMSLKIDLLAVLKEKIS